MTHLRTLVLLVLALCPTTWTLAQASQNLSPDSGIVHKKLPNGFSYFLHRDTAYRGKKIALRLVVKAGSLQEDDTQLGYAHFVEHMGFNGTQHFTQEKLLQFFKKTGMQFGADANALTQFDRTYYQLDVPADSITFLQEALMVLSDWAQNMLFSPEEVEKEKGVILAERRMKQNPQARFSEHMFNWFFQKDTLLRQRSPIGDSTLLTQATSEKLRAFYQRWYRPELMALVAVGDFDQKWMEQQIIQHFQSMPSTPQAPLPKALHTHFLGQRHTTTYAALPVPFFMSNMIFELPGPQNSSPEQFIHDQALEHFITTLVGSELQKNPPSKTTGTNFNFQVNHDLGGIRYFQLIGAGNPQELELILQSALNPIFQLAQGKLSDATFATTQKRLINEAKRFHHDLAGVDNLTQVRAQYFIDAFVQDLPYVALLNALNLVSLEYAKLTKAEVLALTRHWLDPARQMLMLAVSEANQALVPDSTRLWNLVDELENQLPQLEQANEAPKPWLNIPLPKQVKIACQKDHAYDVREIHYANGVKVAIKKQEGLPRVYLRGESYGGLQLVPEPQKMAGNKLFAILTQSGIGSFTAEELAERKANLDLEFFTLLHSDMELLETSSPTEYFPDLMGLLYLSLTQPRFEQQALEHLRQQQQQQEASDQLFIFNILENLHQKQVPNPGVYEREYSHQELQHLKLEDVEKVYRDRFCNLADFTFAIVGDAPLDSLQAIVDPYLGNLVTKVSAPEKHWLEKEKKLKLKPITSIDSTLYVLHEVKAGVEINYLTIRKKQQYPDYLNYLHYASDVLESILSKELREKRGAVYHVGVRAYTNDWCTGIRVIFECAPEGLAELEAAADSCIQAFCSKADQAAIKELYLLQNQQMRRMKAPEVRDHNYWQSRLRAYFDNLDELDVKSEDQLYPKIPYPEKTKSPNIRKFQQFWKRLTRPAKKSRIILLPKTNQVP